MSSGLCQERQLEVVYQWPVLEYATPPGYPSDSDFRAERSLFNSIEVGWDKIFLTTPRIWKGNPASLVYIDRNKATGPSPALQAYPSWEWHGHATQGNVTNCSGMISVFRARIDRCNRLWVLDSGVADSLVTFSVVCPAKLLIFDLATDQLVRAITLPRDVLRPNTLLSNLVIDDQNLNQVTGGYASCDDVFIYMSDTTNPGIVVYDAARDAAWRLQHPFMFPDPNFGTYKVEGESFTLMDGILGMSLSQGYQRRLYFQPFASDRLLSIPVSTLQRGPNPGDDADLPVSIAGTKSSQAAGLATDSDGSLIFSPISETAIAAWLPGTSNYRLITYSPELLQMVLDFRPAEKDNGNIWLVSTRMQKIVRRTLNPQEINLRVMRLVPAPLLPAHNNTLLFY